ncbi:MAG: RlmF-related methyltransferase [Candidatus Heimdallarchaeota archaeon]
MDISRQCVPIKEAARISPKLGSKLKNGKIDLGDSQALLEYNKAVLQIKFGLKIKVPPGHLIPTVCLRYAFIQEVIKSEQKVLEVGTGSSAILAMIMGRIGCKVVATEANKENFLFAQKNVENNNLERLVELRLCAPDEILYNVVKENEVFDRIIAYPPQYSKSQPVRFHQAQRGFGGDELELIGGREGFEFSMKLVQELVESSVLASNGFLALLILNNELVEKLITELRNMKWSYQILEVIAGTRQRYIVKTSPSIEITKFRQELENVFDNR